MKIQHAFLACLLGLILSLSANAADIEYQAQANQILTSSGFKLQLGCLIRIGTFTPGFNFAANATNFSTTNSAFTEFDTAFIGDGGAPAGQFYDNTPYLSGITNLTLYVWIFNSPSAASATEWAILTNPASNWRGPADGSNSTSIDTGDLGTLVPIGALGSIVGGNGSGGDIRLQAAIPEPSSAVQLGLILATAAFRRRYRRGQRCGAYE